MDEAVRRWKQRGRIFFWFEPSPRQGDGWHIAADEIGCDDLDEIIRLCREAAFPARFRVAITDARGRSSFLTVSCDREWASDHWRIQGSETPVLELGEGGLDLLSRAVIDLRRGHGDYTIGAREPDHWLWVWWPPG